MQWSLIFGFCSFVISLYSGQYFISALGLGFSLFVMSSFVENLGKGLPVLHLMSSLAHLQWILAAWLTWHLFDGKLSYIMYIDEKSYMQLAVPATMSYHFGLFAFPHYHKSEWKVLKKKCISTLHHNVSGCLVIIGIGLACQLLPPTPSELHFLRYFFEQLRYVGAIALLFNPTPSNLLLTGAIICHGLFFAIKTSFFHEFFLWLTFSGLFLFWNNERLNKKKWILISFICSFFFLIQVTKHDYRRLIWYHQKTDYSISLYISLIKKKLIEGEILTFEHAHGAIARINQGWINSRVMYFTPTFTNYGKGTTIINAISASLIPRFMFSNKKKAGGKENFERFTGLQLQPGVSMGISLLGEGFANFGKTGCALFLFVAGLFFRFAFSLALRLATGNTLILLFIPLLFLQVVKAETELVVVLNHLIKGFLFTLIMVEVLKKTVFKCK